MSNIFANYGSGDELVEKRPSFKVSELIGKVFSIESLRVLDMKTSQFSDDPTMRVFATLGETGEKIVFFAQQKVLFDKLSYLKEIGYGAYGTHMFKIVSQATKDGKASYYDILDAGEKFSSQ